MVTKHQVTSEKANQSSVLAKILMVTKQTQKADLTEISSVLAKILMVTKPFSNIWK